MKISTMIKQLNEILVREGDLEVTCTGTLLPDGYSTTRQDVTPHMFDQDVFETTADNLIVVRESSKTSPAFDGPRLRIFR